MCCFKISEKISAEIIIGVYDRQQECKFLLFAFASPISSIISGISHQWYLFDQWTRPYFQRGGYVVQSTPTRTLNSTPTILQTLIRTNQTCIKIYFVFWRWQKWTLVVYMEPVALFFIFSLGGQSFISSQSGCTAATPFTTDGPVPHPQPHRHNHRQHWQSSGHPAIDCRRFRACAASATAGASRYVTAAGKSFGFGNWVEGVSAMFRKLGFRVCLRDFKKLLCS